MARFISSDIHFDHKMIAHWRGFSSTDEMNELIIANWNSKVSKKDDVYILGDFTLNAQLKKAEEFIDRLNYAQLYFIMGNHDNDKMKKSSKFIWVKDYHEMKHNNIPIIMCHYPLATWRNVHYGSVNFHGHCHGSYPSSNRQLDIGIDTNNLSPYTFDEAFDKMKILPEFIIPDRIKRD